MPIYDAPIRDMQFLLHDVLKLQNYSNLPGFADATPDVIDAFLEESGKWHREVLAPLNRVGDQEGCTRHDDASVTTPTGFKDAYQQYCESGFGSIAMDPNYGGQGLPLPLSMAVSEMTSSANQAFAMYPGLSGGAWRAIHMNGSEEQKQTYLPKMTTGEWTGTMNLTEPHCGTDLGLLRTKAVPQWRRVTYHISGQKILDLGRRARYGRKHRSFGPGKNRPDAPAGRKRHITLFVVPKFLVNEDGNSLGQRNGVSLW